MIDSAVHLEHPARRMNLTAASLLEYWAKLGVIPQGVIPHYAALIEGVRERAMGFDVAGMPALTGE